MKLFSVLIVRPDLDSRRIIAHVPGLLAAFLLLLIATGPVLAAPDSLARGPFLASSVVSQELPCGLGCVVDQVPASAQVSLVVSLEAGSHLDEAATSGLANLLAELKSSSLEGWLDASSHPASPLLGTGLLQNSNKDYTSFSLSCSLLNWREALRAIFTVLFVEEPKAEQLDKARPQVLSELERLAQNPTYSALDRAHQAIYAGHPYALPVRGSRESLQALALRDVISFWRQHYVARQAGLVVSGPVLPEEVFSFVTSELAPLLRAGEAAPAVPVAPAPPSRGIITEGSLGDNAHILVAFTGPSLDSPKRVWQYDVLLYALLGYGPASVMSVLGDVDLRNPVSVEFLTFEGPALLTLGLDVPEDQASSVIAALQRHFDGLPSKLTPEVLEDARRRLLAGFLAGNQNPRERADALAFYQRKGGYSFGVDYTSNITALKLSELPDLASKKLAWDEARLLLVYY